MRSKRNYLRKFLGFALIIGASFLTTRGAAQDVSSSGILETAAEYWSGYGFYTSMGILDDAGRQRLPRTQIDSVLQVRAAAWVKSLQARPVSGLQLDPMGSLAVVAGHQELAKEQFAERLKTPDLSVEEKAYTLLVAVSAFSANSKSPGHMLTAREYLGLLDKLPSSSDAVKIYRFVARASLAEDYYLSGDGTQALSLIKESFRLIPEIEYVQRDWDRIITSFTILANVLSGRHNGRTEIDSLGRHILALSQVPPSLLAQDSLYYGWMKQYADMFKMALAQTSFLGRQAPAIEAQYWFNTASPEASNPIDSRIKTKPVDDGKIRVIMLGHYGCPGCLASLPKVDRMRKNVPANVEMWYVATENDIWGITRKPPDEIAEHYRKYYVDKKRYGMPIALWIGERRESIEGGTVNESSPTIDKYNILGWPTVVVTDVQGRVRLIRIGFNESIVKRTIQYLANESLQTNASNR